MEPTDNDIKVPFQGAEVAVRRCGPSDLLALTDWCDLYLQGDFHFKRRHMQGILTRGTSDCWAIMVNGVFSGLCIIYRGSTLHNLYLDPQHRGGGIGAAVLLHFKPTIVRAKCNMSSGDPTPFYEANGYAVVEHDAAKPHIAIMQRTDTPSIATGTPAAKPDDEPIDWAALKRQGNTERSRRRRARLKEERAALARAQHTESGGEPVIVRPQTTSNSPPSNGHGASAGFFCYPG